MSNDEAVRKAWQTNLDVNLELVRHLTPEMLSAQTPGGGFSVAQHLAHIVASVKYWGMALEKGAFAGLADLYDPDAEEFVAENDREKIETVLKETYECARAAAERHPRGSAELPHADASAFLLHMMVHDAHHRGQVLLALKVSGHPLPAEQALWAPWRE
ncbi:MAG: DinB family protein [Trueperaceae bacterium]|nr:MAG: DinB family protein [Trueperaceae bacterium]